MLSPLFCSGESQFTGKNECYRYVLQNIDPIAVKKIDDIKKEENIFLSKNL